MDVWKEFDAGVITHSASHYLAAIGHLTDDQGYARAVDVARHLDITRGSVSLALKTLKARDLVREDGNRFLALSEEGERIVKQIRTRRQRVRDFFENILGVDPDQAETDACKIEHLLSEEVCDRLDKFLRRHRKRRRRTQRAGAES